VRLLIDALPITGDSGAIVTEHIVAAWAKLGLDEIDVVAGPGLQAPLPDSVTFHELPYGKRAAISRLRHQNITLPKIARRTGADAVLGIVPNTTVAPLPCPRFVIGPINWACVSARCSLVIAPVRVGAWAMILAIIES